MNFDRYNMHLLKRNVSKEDREPSKRGRRVAWMVRNAVPQQGR